MPDVHWSTNCAFGDYDRDGHLDLYVANYMTFDEKTVPHSLDNCSLILFEDGLQETPVILEQLQRSPFV